MSNENDPTSWSLGIWALGIFMSIAGGFINWWSKIKQGKTRGFNLVELCGEIMVSGVVGLGVFMLLVGLEYPLGIAGAAAGIGGHMGARLLFILERVLEERLLSGDGKEGKK